MNFTKTNIPTTKGRQSSKWDVLVPEFQEQGDSLQFEESEVSRPAASAAAKRLTLLTGKNIHSFYDVKEKKVTIRWRKDGELQEKDEDNDPSLSELNDNTMPET